MIKIKGNKLGNDTPASESATNVYLSLTNTLVNVGVI